MISGILSVFLMAFPYQEKHYYQNYKDISGKSWKGNWCSLYSNLVNSGKAQLLESDVAGITVNEDVRNWCVYM